MVQKLSKTLYQKVLMKHQRYARVKGLKVPEEKDLLHQQIVHSPELNKYIDRGKLATKKKKEENDTNQILTLTSNNPKACLRSSLGRLSPKVPRGSSLLVQQGQHVILEKS
jgi:hypothetical protein